jgi:alkylated DNA repair dioxygenase AlkB
MKEHCRQQGLLVYPLELRAKFRICDKATNNIVMDIPTNSNEILIMGGDFQKEFTHEVPVEKKITTARISFTFRKHLR